MNSRDFFYIFDKPVPINGILLYPVLMSDYILFNYYIDCLTIDKNSIPDVNIITMNYLEYLFSISNKQNNLLEKLNIILSLSTKIDNENISFGFDNKKKPIIKIDDKIINGNDFENIRKIICEQNSIELEDETIQKEIRDKLKEARNFKNKSSNTRMGSLEDQIICILISTSMNMDDIFNMTIRKFVKTLQRVDVKLHYQIYLSASLSGLVEFKDKSFIKHWMSDLESDRNENLIATDSVEKKLSGKK